MLTILGIWFLWAIVSIQTSISASPRSGSSWLTLSPGNIEEQDVASLDMVQSSLNDDADVTAEHSVSKNKSPDSACPYELRSGDTYGTGPKSLTRIYKILTACSETRILHLTVEQGGCVVTDNILYFEFSHRDRFPPLEELRFDGYDLDGRRTAIRRQRERADASSWRWYRNYLADVTGIDFLRRIGSMEEPDPASVPTNLDLFRGAMDWTMLQRLEIIHPLILSV